jgi:hypothetical protein
MIVNSFTTKLVILIWSQESYYKVHSQATGITMPSINNTITSALMKILGPDLCWVSGVVQETPN